jgi:hypothetical protein
LGVFNVDKVRGSGDTTWPEQKEYFDMAYSNVALLKSLLEGAIGYAKTRHIRDRLRR